MRILLLYRLIQFLSLPVLFFYFILRILTNTSYRAKFSERLGFLPREFQRPAPGSIWLHAVSAGEIATAVPLLRQLREAEPSIPIYVSTSTVAGRTTGAARLHDLVAGVFYCPLDFASCVRRVLKRLKPSLVIILETEIWPNLYAETKRIGASLAIVNGRISDKSLPQYLSMKWFFAPILRQPDIVFAQSSTDRDRYFRLGVPLSRLQLEGDLKYDASVAAPPLAIPTFGASAVWVAASTVAPGESRHYRHDVDEDDIVLDAFEKITREIPGLLLVLAPRQPQRFSAVAAKLERRLIPFVRRTELKRQSVDLRLPGVLLLDTLGELAGVFSQADVVFVGGSIAPRGGHNILEPAAFAVPIIIGLHMHNFESITRDFLGENALLQITSADELAPAVMDLLRHPETARAMGRRAQMLVEHKRGAAERVAQQLWPLYWAATPRNPYGILARIILAPLAGLWVWLGAIKARRDQAHQQRLPVPVIGVGGITTGGAGKTPFTNHLATELTSRGYRPAILTRGYRRRTPARNVILPPGARVSPALTGDEAQIFLRSTGCPVGIGADRAATGRLLMQHLSVDLFLLDDGFQHRKIYRDVDIVVIDGLQPFGLHHPVPLGRLREPLSALKRADVFVVTRADNNLRFEFLSRKLHTYNRTAPVFRVFTRPRGWRLHQQRVITAGLPTTRVAAFCALGNPQSFWNTLAQLGLDVVFRWSFPDHHVYQPAELRRISMQAQEQGASVLVTTEKDWINFPKDFAQNVAPLEVAWLEIENVIEGEAEFFTWLGDRLSKRFASSA